MYSSTVAADIGTGIACNLAANCGFFAAVSARWICAVGESRNLLQGGGEADIGGKGEHCFRHRDAQTRVRQAIADRCAGSRPR